MPMKTIAKQNPRSTQVNVEFFGMFFAEDIRGKRGNFNVEEEGTGNESHRDEIVPSDGAEGGE